MKYTIIIKRTAQKQIQRLPKIYLAKIKKAILGLESNPRPPGCTKLTGTINTYRIRVGKYRLVYSIEDAELVIFLFDVDHRKDVYR